MSKIGNDSSNGGGDETRKPNKVVVFDDKVGENRKEGIIKASNADAYYEIAKGMLGGFDVCGGILGLGFFCFHFLIVTFFGDYTKDWVI